MGIVTIHLTVDETDKLLQFLGHDSAVLEQIDVVNLVKALYRTLVAFDGKNAADTLTFPVSGEQLLVIHRYFTTAAFGPGGREFQQKLAEAFVAVERLEDIPEIEAAETIDGQPFGSIERLGLAHWEDLESW